MDAVMKFSCFLLSSIPTKTDGQFELRYYQENAVNAVVKALSEGKKRILLTLATGTGKNCIAFQIVWKLMQAKWNTKKHLAKQGVFSFGSGCRIRTNDRSVNSRLLYR